MKKLYLILLLITLGIVLIFGYYYITNNSNVIIQNSNGNKLRINALIADSDAEKTKGLAILNELPEQSGMLFLNSIDTTNPFWMLNMKFPIDIIFMDSNKRIIYIFKNAQPCVNESLCKLIFADQPYRYVLEVNSGFTDKNNIEIGNQITWK